MARKPCVNCHGAQAVRAGGLCNKCFGSGATVPTFPVETVLLDMLRMDGDTQCRVSLSEDKVQEYAETMRGGAAFPPGVLFRDEEGNNWPADGFTRAAAAADAGRDSFDFEVRPGNQLDAIHHAAGANATHGQPRTDADKRNAVRKLLKYHADWSTNQLAETAKVSWDLADKVRKEVEAASAEPPPETRTAVNGTHHPAKQPSKKKPAPTSRAGSTPAPRWEDQVPDEAVDPLGQVIPDALRDVFGTTVLAHAVAQLESLIPALRDATRWAPFLRDETVRQLEALKEAVANAQPFAVCALCKGKGCNHCRAGGHVTKGLYYDLVKNGAWTGPEEPK